MVRITKEKLIMENSLNSDLLHLSSTISQQQYAICRRKTD